ncbi:MAG: RICIN domain-containing protein [Coriobacteriales bacterium]|jgi:lipoprotein-anchoring transpeptidase ErfK/SrfK|nr:RICIN domain-containing protein [Coriobacteriales bacterium]
MKKTNKVFLSLLVALVLIVSSAVPAPFAFADEPAQAGALGPVQNGSQTQSATGTGDTTADDDFAKESFADDDAFCEDAESSAEASDADDFEGDVEDTSDEASYDNGVFDSSEGGTINALAAPRLDTPLAPGRYLLRPATSNTRVLEVADASKDNQANIQLNTSDMTKEQLFDVRFDNKTGFYTFKNVKSGKLLTVAAKTARANTNIWQEKATGKKNQKWIVTADPTRAGAFRITSALSTTTKNGEKLGKFALSIKGGNKDKANAQLAKTDSGKAQSFYLMPKTPAVLAGNASIASGFYTLNTTLPKNCAVSVRGDGIENAEALELALSNKTLERSVYIQRQSDGFYTLRFGHSGAAITVPKGNLVAGIGLQQKSIKKAPSASQRWAIVKNQDGSFTFISKSSGMALAVKGKKGAAGSTLRQWYPNNSAQQRFTLQNIATVALKGPYVTISPQKPSSMFVEVTKASRKSDAKLRAVAGAGGNGQIFEAVRISDGVYAFKSTNSSFYLTAANGAVVQQSAVSAPSTNQQWKLTPVIGGMQLTSVSTGQALTIASKGKKTRSLFLAQAAGTQTQLFKVNSVPLPLAQQTYTISNTSNKRIAGGQNKASVGTILKMEKASKSSAQRWMISHVRGDYFVLKCVRSGNTLEIKNGSTKNGTKVQLGANRGSKKQLWRAIPTGDGWFYLQSASGMYLTSGSGNKLTVQKSISGKAQKFRFSQTSYTGLTGTYVDVNISTQRLRFIKDGMVVLECDVVTGKPSTATPTGTYRIMSKARNVTLVGPGYASPVKYWMPFTAGGVGLHDASWQSGFGGNRWNSGYGSHGCVNMPLWAVRDLYGQVKAGTVVQVHR